MGRQIARRGPDEGRILIDDPLALVFRRLSIVDMAHGRQPLVNEDGTLRCVVNGEIYNYKELRRSLEGRHQFATQSDSEVVLHLYEDLGPECLKHLNGMFAVAIWSTRERKLFLARDRMGIKPLFYGCSPGGTLHFGSEVKALVVHPECPNELAWRDCKDRLINVHSDHAAPTLKSYVEGIQQLPGGTWAQFDERGLQGPNKYWDLQEAFGTNEPTTSGDFVERYAELISDSVSLRLSGEAEIGVFLSGGLDSAVIAHQAAKHIPNLRCFSISNEAIAASGDLARARRMARQLDVDEFAGGYSKKMRGGHGTWEDYAGALGGLQWRAELEQARTPDDLRDLRSRGSGRLDPVCLLRRDPAADACPAACAEACGLARP